MNKHKLLLLPLAWLLAFMAFACDPPDDDDASSGPSKLTINNAMYDVGTALLTVQGTHLGSATQAQIQTIVVDGVDLNSYTADAKPTGPDNSGLAEGKYRLKTNGTALWLRLTNRHKATLQGKPGMNKDGRKVGLLTSSGTWAGLNTAKDLTVSGNPAITRATYDVDTGVLEINGTNLPKTFEGWDFGKLTLVSGDGKKKYTLPRQSIIGSDTASVSDASATKLSILLRVV